MNVLQKSLDPFQSRETTASRDFFPHLRAKRIVYRNFPGSESGLLSMSGHATNYLTQAGEQPYRLLPPPRPPIRVLLAGIVTPQGIEPVSSQRGMGRANYRPSAPLGGPYPILPTTLLYRRSPSIFPQVSEFTHSLTYVGQTLQNYSGRVVLNGDLSSARDVSGSHTRFPIPQPPGSHQCPPNHPFRFHHLLAQPDGYVSRIDSQHLLEAPYMHMHRDVGGSVAVLAPAHPFAPVCRSFLLHGYISPSGVGGPL